jgi:UDP-N-acetylglucosamine 2-epimerase (non-hydrolysing)
MSAPNPEGPLLCVVGARPNYMKMAPLVAAFRERSDLPAPYLLHTGQHYDVEMKQRLFADLGMPAPDVDLGVGSGTHAQQTGEIMRRFEPVLDDLGASCVIVVGDVNSTLACGLVASKKNVPLVHVEAGLRSFDRRMPEEINRVLTDQLADVLYTTERSAHGNLLREGVAAERVVFVGNVMIDSLTLHRRLARAPADTLRAAGLSPEVVEDEAGYALVTLHRPSNVDERAALGECLVALQRVAARMPVIWPVHPRARANLEQFGLARSLEGSRIVLLPPQGYLEMLGLMQSARVVLTDSGGVQEETTALGVPCLTMRENTERPITVEQGTNTLVARDTARIDAEVARIASGSGKRGRIPELWDGHAAQRIAAHLAGWLEMPRAPAEAVLP